MPKKEINPSKLNANGKVDIDFKHRLSKLNLTVRRGTEFNKLEGGTTNNLISLVEVNGTNTQAVWVIIEDKLYNYSWTNGYNSLAQCCCL